MIGRRHILYTAPLLVAGAAGLSFIAMLGRMRGGEFDPHDIGSPMTGKKIPQFSLSGLAGAKGFTSNDLAAQNRPVLINFFASWCAPCMQEAPLLAELADNIPIWGIAYKDAQPDTMSYLKHYGNPYQRLACDTRGLTAIDFGLYGVPETFVIDQLATIRARYAGALTDDIIGTQLLPLLQTL